MGLTKRQADALRYDPNGPDQQIKYDGTLAGFGLRVYPSGVKSFVLAYRTRSGRPRILTLGRYCVLTLDQARKRARKELVKITDGGDPLEERRQQVRQVTTFGELAQRYIDEYAKLHRKSWREDERRLNKYILPKIGKVAVDKVSAADVRALHAAMGKTAPIEANRIAGLIRAIYNRAKRWELVSEAHPNPATRIDRFRETPRERWLTAAEIKRLVKELNTEPDLYATAAIRLLLLTGCRKTELLRARWDRLDLDARRLLLEDTKTGAPKVVPLSAPAREILRSLPRMLHSPWVFPSPKKAGEPREDIKRSWDRIRVAARVPDATIHDLRRTTGSWLVQQGVPLKVIGAALGHRDTRATEVYARIAATQPAEALEMLGEAFGGLMKAAAES